MLLDEIGAAIVVAHGDSSAFAWLLADERPALVKGIAVIEPAGPAFDGYLQWGLTASPMTYDPPAATPAELRTTPPMAESGVVPYRLQAQPPRRLKYLADIPIAVVTAEASDANRRDPGTVAFLRQAGCTVEHLKLAEHGVHGNGPYMMLEKNNREALEPILAWVRQHVPRPSSAATAVRRPSSTGSTAMKLADQGYFWTGVKRKQVPYGTVASGQMFVQYFIPQEVRYPYPMVLIHGGGGQATHYMGIGRRPGWIHYFVQEGYRVYNVDRPASGRSPYHPDSFDRELSGVLARLHLGLFDSFERAAEGPYRVFQTPQWPGNGEIGEDPFIDQFVPGEIGSPADLGQAADAQMFLDAGTALLDKIGPAILHTLSYSGPLGWALADRRSALVKGIVAIEPNGLPFDGQLTWGLTSVPMKYDPAVASAAELSLSEVAGPPNYHLQSSPARSLRNLRQIPIGWVLGELRADGPAEMNNEPPQIAFLKQAGCKVDSLDLRARGIRGNGNLMMLEKNNQHVFNVIRDWLTTAVAAPSRHA
jgi:pimeloyl-ACP methyl ester carboxylesterase